MNTQIQQEIMNPINQISTATTDKTNREYQITLLRQHLTRGVKEIKIYFVN
jgi:hypothetical protein